MLRQTPLYLRLNPADDVVIACASSSPGTNLIQENLAVKERNPGRPQGGDPRADRRRRAGAPLQPDHRLRHPGDRAGMHVHVHNLEVRDFARDYAYGETYQPTGPGARAGHVPGHRARRRPRRHRATTSASFRR
jgi:altronate hydrolase